jgi:predicted ATPase
VQVALGDLLIAGMRPDERMLMIETHSEHLLLRLLRRIRETTDGELPESHPGLRAEQLAVVYVESEDGRIDVTALRVDETGEFRDRWPRGFFRERESELF